MRTLERLEKSMNIFAKSLTAIAVATVATMASVPAQAANITFDYQVPTDGSGKTSNLVNANNTSSNPFVFIETFDKPGSAGGAIAANGGTVIVQAGGGFNTLNPATDLIITQGSLGIRQGSVSGVAAAPAGDTSFYAFGPGPNSGSAAKVTVDYAASLAALPGVNVTYLGLYYGSIDTYNNIAFYGKDTKGDGYDDTDLIKGTGYFSDGVVTGSELLSVFGGQSGNQTQNSSNIYANFFFDQSEGFTAFEFRTTGIAFELDNVVTGYSNRDLPEPGSLALLALGLFGLAGMRRKA